MTIHFHLLTLRLEHTVHILPLTCLPSSLTPVQPVIFTLTTVTFHPSSPPLLDLSMDLEKAVGQLKVRAMPNYMPNYLPVVDLVSSDRVHGICLTPHLRSFQSLVSMKQTVTPYLMMDSVLLLRTKT